MKTNRNDPCPCGSGRKYKRCCIHKNEDITERQPEQKLIHTPHPSFLNPQPIPKKNQPKLKGLLFCPQWKSTSWPSPQNALPLSFFSVPIPKCSRNSFYQEWEAIPQAEIRLIRKNTAPLFKLHPEQQTMAYVLKAIQDESFSNYEVHSDPTQGLSFRPSPLFESEFIQNFRSLRLALQYWFDDGAIFTAHEITWTNYLRAVPKALLPFRENLLPHFLNQKALSINPEPQHFPFSFAPHLKFYTEKARNQLKLAQATHLTDAIVLSLLQRVVQNEGNWNIPLYLVNKQSFLENRQACLIQKVQYTSSIDPYWKLDFQEGPYGRGVLTLSQNEEDEINHQSSTLSPTWTFPQFAWTPSEQKIEFHPLSHSHLCFQEIENGQIERKAVYAQGGKKIIQIYSHQKIQDFLFQASHFFKQEGISWKPSLHPHLLSPENTVAQFWVEEDGSFLFTLQWKWKEKVYSIWDFPSSIQNLFSQLNSSLDCFLEPQEEQNLKESIHPIHKAFAKQEGIHLCLFHSVLEEVLQGKPTFTAEAMAALFKKVSLLLLSLAKENFNPNTPPALKDLCAPFLIRAFERRAQALFSLLKEPPLDFFYHSSGVFQLDRLHPFFLSLIHRLLQPLLEESEGKLFTKRKILNFESCYQRTSPSLFEGSGEETQLQKKKIDQEGGLSVKDLSTVSLLRTLANLPMTVPVELFYQGTRLEILKDGEIQSQIHLKNSDEYVQNETPTSWFELHPKIFLKGQEISMNDLLGLGSLEGVLPYQGKFYLISQKNLPSFQQLENFWKNIQTHSQKASRKKISSWDQKYILLPKNKTLDILALRNSGIPTVGGGKKWDEICKFYDSLDQKRELTPIPSTVCAELKPYQHTGVQWLIDLYHLKLGGILADDMGLGKTLQTLAFLEILRTQGKLGAVLIVVPTSLSYNWVNEIKKFTPQLLFELFQPKEKLTQLKRFKDTSTENAPEGKVLICSYGLLMEHAEDLESLPWNILIFDEAQNLKNITAKRTTVARQLKASFKLCLTGTPIENHLGEFYSLLDLVTPGCLGDYQKFRALLVNPLWIKKKDLEHLKLKTKPLVLRRNKALLLSELPQKQESVLVLPFEKKQEKIYRNIAVAWNEKVKKLILDKGEKQSQLMMFTALLRLRQACSDPSAIPDTHYTECPPKIELLIETLEELLLRKESALVFTQFISTFDRVAVLLKKEGIPFFGLNGTTPRIQRERILESFQKDTEGSVLLMTLKTGGVGLNLTRASYVFHLEPWWNPSVENQATDRAYRMGQAKQIQVYRYIMKDSVEEKIQILKEKKQERFLSLFPDGIEDSDPLSFSKQGSPLLSQQDFNHLLS